MEEVALTQLRFDEDNARLHPEENIGALCKSLSQFGQPEPLLVQRSNGMVISGNGRLEAMQKLGWEKAQVNYVDWSDEKARAYSLVANRTAELAKWDFTRLQEQVDALADTLDLGDLGFAEYTAEAMADNPLHEPPEEYEAAEEDEENAAEPAPPAGAPAAERQSAQPTNQSPEEAPPTAHVKLIQLFYDEETCAEFYEKTDKLREATGHDNLSDLILALVRQCAK